MFQKIIDTFKVLDENYLVKTFIISSIFMLFFSYNIFISHGIFVILLFIPWLLLGTFFSPFALIPVFKFMNGFNNILSNWIFFDRLLLFILILKFTLWVSGIFLALFFFTNFRASNCFFLLL